jgi:hypothetical protein
VNWTVVIDNDRVQIRGTEPRVDVPSGADRMISRAYGNPETQAPALVKQLSDEGYSFRIGHDVTAKAGATDVFLLGLVGGFYIQEPNAYDGFIGLHYAQAKRLQSFDTVDWTAPYLDEKTWRYPGYYVVLNRSVGRIDKV